METINLKMNRPYTPGAQTECQLENLVTRSNMLIQFINAIYNTIFIYFGRILAGVLYSCTIIAYVIV